MSGPAHIPVLLEEAIAALAEYPGEQVVDQLISVLNDKNWQVRCLAIAALAKGRQTKALGALIASMQRDPEQLVSVAAIEVLGAIGGTRRYGVRFHKIGLTTTN